MSGENMQIEKYLYFFTYNDTESELCKLESKYIFAKKEKGRRLTSDVKVEPSLSAFVKSRLDVISFSVDYETLIRKINLEGIHKEGFKIEYIVLEGDSTLYTERLDMLRDIGYNIEGFPDYYNPKCTYALCNYEGTWCFGMLTKDDFDWYKHKQKPCSYSQSINTNIAKALANIAAKVNKQKKLLDACCGVGTILLEACFSGYNIEGCDINSKISKAAEENLSYFKYTAKIYHSDISEINKRYNAAILDLPYNLSSRATEDDLLHIIESAAKLTDRLVMVSTTDILDLITKTGFKVLEFCSVSKKGKTRFARKIWVCERKE